MGWRDPRRCCPHPLVRRLASLTAFGAASLMLTALQASPAGAEPAHATSTPPTGCRTADLRATLGPRVGAAGSTYGPLRLTNIGSTACLVEGYPGVSYVAGPAYRQVGSPASRSYSERPVLIALAPGRSASATLREINPLDFPPASCQPTATRGLRVYPPDQRASLFVAVRGQACANPADTELTVGVLEPATT